MLEVRKTVIFETWLHELRDVRAQALIAERVRRLAFFEHFGDARAVGRGVIELRVDHGPGYRVYLTRRGKRIVVLLRGGDKRTQRRDVVKAIELAANLED